MDLERQFVKSRIRQEIGINAGYLYLNVGSGQLELEPDREGIRGIGTDRLAEHILLAICKADTKAHRYRMTSLGKVQTASGPLSIWFEESMNNIEGLPK